MWSGGTRWLWSLAGDSVAAFVYVRTAALTMEKKKKNYSRVAQWPSGVKYEVVTKKYSLCYRWCKNKSEQFRSLGCFSYSSIMNLRCQWKHNNKHKKLWRQALLSPKLEDSSASLTNISRSKFRPRKLETIAELHCPSTNWLLSASICYCSLHTQQSNLGDDILPVGLMTWKLQCRPEFNQLNCHQQGCQKICKSKKNKRHSNRWFSRMKSPFKKHKGERDE